MAANSANSADMRLVVLHDRSKEHAAREWQTFQLSLLDAVEQAVVATDPLGYIQYWNRGAEQLYGWTSAEVLGSNVGAVIVAPELQRAGREIMARLRRGETWQGEFPIRHRDGTEIPVLVTDSPVRNNHGELIGIIGVAMDMSERIRAERDRRALSDLQSRVTRDLAQVDQLANDPGLPHRSSARGRAVAGFGAPRRQKRARGTRVSDRAVASARGEPVSVDRLLRTLEQLLAIEESELHVALARAAQIVREVLAADNVDVFLFDTSTQSLMPHGTSDRPGGQRRPLIGMDGPPLVGGGRVVRVFQTGEVVLNDRVDEDPLNPSASDEVSRCAPS